jgi:hypothetical protein
MEHETFVQAASSGVRSKVVAASIDQNTESEVSWPLGWGPRVGSSRGGGESRASLGTSPRLVLDPRHVDVAM